MRCICRNIYELRAAGREGEGMVVERFGTAKSKIANRRRRRMRERKRKDREALNSWGRSFFTFQLLLLSQNRFSKNYQKTNREKCWEWDPCLLRGEKPRNAVRRLKESYSSVDRVPVSGAERQLRISNKSRVMTEEVVHTVKKVSHLFRFQSLFIVSLTEILAACLTSKYNR